MDIRTAKIGMDSRDTRDSGFTVVEVVVAMGLAMFIIASSFLVINAGLVGLVQTRTGQEATAIANTALEDIRDMSHDDLVLNSSGISSDTAIVSGMFDPDATGPLLDEPVVAAAGATALSPHETQETSETGTPFTIKRYITWADVTTQGGANQDVKRATVVVTWPGPANATRSTRVSTLLANVRRGLPVPDIRLRPISQSVTAAPGSTVVFPHTVKNLSVTDTVDLSLEIPAGKTWSVSFYLDVDEDGIYTPATDTALADTNGNLKVDTGPLVLDEMVFVLAVWTLPGSESANTYNLTLTASSGRDPSVTETATDTLVVDIPALVLYLHNNPTPPVGNTTAQSQMSMSIDAPTATTLYQYSTNYYTGAAGRFVDEENVAANENNAEYMANWVYQMPQTTVLSGDASLRVWVAIEGLACDKTAHLRVFLRDKSSASTRNGTLISEQTVTYQPQGTAPCNFAQVDLTWPVSYTINNNRWLELKISVDEVTAAAGLFAYDTTTYMSYLSVPQATS